MTGGSSLTFTNSNWNTAQTVTIGAAEDADTANGSATITVSSTGLTNKTVTASEVDNDAQNLVVSTTALSVNEGSSNTFTVKLAAQPAANVTVTVARTAGDADLSVTGGSSLTFTNSNWNTAQTVTIGAAEDADTANGSATITVSSTGLANKTVTANEVDNDALPNLRINDVTVDPEGNSGTKNAVFTVTLSRASNRTVSVNWATADDTAKQPGDYTSGSGKLTFNPGVTTRTITVAVKGDLLDEVNEQFRVNLAAAINATISDGLGLGTIVDDDNPATTARGQGTLVPGDGRAAGVSELASDALFADLAGGDRSSALRLDGEQARSSRVTAPADEIEIRPTTLASSERDAVPQPLPRRRWPQYEDAVDACLDDLARDQVEAANGQPGQQG